MGWAHTSLPVPEAVSHWIFAGLFCKGRCGISSSPRAELDFPATVLLPLEGAEVEALCCFCSFEFQPRMTKVSSGDVKGKDQPEVSPFPPPLQLL